MFCNKCGKEVKIGSQFCPYCGNQFSIQQQNTAQSQQPRPQANGAGNNVQKGAASVYPKHAHDYAGLLNAILLIVNVLFVLVFLLAPLFVVDYFYGSTSVTAVKLPFILLNSFSYIGDYLGTGSSEVVLAMIISIVYSLAFYVPIVFIIVDFVKMGTGKLKRSAMFSYIWMLSLLAVSLIIKLIVQGSVDSEVGVILAAVFNFGIAFEFYIFLSIAGIVAICVIKSLAKKGVEIIHFGNKSAKQQAAQNPYQYGQVDSSSINYGNQQNAGVQQPIQNQVSQNAYSNTVVISGNNSDTGSTSDYAQKLFLIGGNKRLELKGFPAVIGRNADLVNYVLDEPAVSKVHCEIAYGNGGFYIKDLGSSNGTFVNGNRILKGQNAAIKAKDRIKIGNVEFVLYVGV